MLILFFNQEQCKQTATLVCYNLKDLHTDINNNPNNEDISDIALITIHQLSSSKTDELKINGTTGQNS